MQILILPWVSVVQRVMLVLRSIRCSEINGDVQVDLAAAEDILKEVHDWFELEANDVNLGTLNSQRSLALVQSLY